MKTVDRNSCSRAVGVGLAILAAFCIFSRNALRAADGAPSAGGRIDTEEIRAGLERHDRAMSIKRGWIRDPYITLAPDGYYNAEWEAFGKE